MLILLHGFLLFGAAPDVQTVTPAVAVEDQRVCQTLESFPIEGTSWLLVNTNFIKDAAGQEGVPAGAFLLDNAASDFTLMKVSVWEQFKTDFRKMFDELLSKRSLSPDLNRVLDSLKGTHIIFTVGEHVETLGPEDASFVQQLADKYPAQLKVQATDMAVITLNLQELAHSAIHVIQAKRKIDLQQGTRVLQGQDYYLLVPFLQPAYMILTHELLHVLFNRQKIDIDFPPQEWQERHLLWSQHFDQKDLTEHGGLVDTEIARAAYEKVMGKLWTNADELGVIMGIPGRQGMITENSIRYQLQMRLRALHVGPNNETASSSLYEPSWYIDETMGQGVVLAVPKDVSLSEADYYALAKLYRHIKTSRKGSSGTLTPNVSETGVGQQSGSECASGTSSRNSGPSSENGDQF